MDVSTKYIIYMKSVLLQQVYNLIWQSEDSQKDGCLRNKLKVKWKERRAVRPYFETSHIDSYALFCFPEQRKDPGYDTRLESASPGLASQFYYN